MKRKKKIRCAWQMPRVKCKKTAYWEGGFCNEHADLVRPPKSLGGDFRRVFGITELDIDFAIQRYIGRL